MQYDMIRFAKSMKKQGLRTKLSDLIIEHSRFGALGHDLRLTIGKVDAIYALSENYKTLNGTPLAAHVHTIMQALFDSAVVLFVGSTNPRQGIPQGMDLTPYLTDRQRQNLADLHELRSKSIAHRVDTGPRGRSVYHTDDLILDEGNGFGRYGRRSSWKQDLVESIKELTGIALAEIAKIDASNERDLIQEFRAELTRDESLYRDLGRFPYNPNKDTGSTERLHMNGVSDWVEAARPYHLP